MRGIHWMLASAAAYALFSASLAEAQSAAPADKTGADNKTGTDKLPDIIVSARRTSERLQDVPIAVTALSGADLLHQSVKEFRDIGATVPNVRFEEANSSADSVNIEIRGQSQADVLLTTDSSVGFYFDNVSIPRLYGLRGSFVDMERVEVLRGPQGTLYGRNTTGGAVSVFSKEPTRELGGSLSLGYGNFNDKEAVGVLNVPLTDSLSVRVVGAFTAHDGYGHDRAGRDVADENNKYFRGTMKYQSGRFTATLMGDYTHYRDGGPMGGISAIVPANVAAHLPPGGLATLELASELQGAITPASINQALGLLTQYSTTRPNGNFYDTWGAQRQFTHYQGWRVALNMSYELSDAVVLKSITGASGFSRESLYEADATPYPIGTTDSHVNDNFFSQELQLQGNTGRFKWVAGGYYSHEHGHDFTVNTYLPVLASGLIGIQDGEATNESMAAFGQASYKLTNAITLTGGIRYTRETKRLITRNRQIVPGATVCSVPSTVLIGPGCVGSVSNHFSKPSWLISADWKPIDNLLLYAKVSRGFRGGGQNLRGTSTVTFQPFAPELATEYEIGAKSELFDRRLRLNVALWHDDYKNIQRSVVVLNPATGSLDTLITNAAAAKLQGVEAEATLRATRQLTLSGSVGYFHARYVRFVDFTGDRSGEAWPLTPNWTYSLSGHYEVPTHFGKVSAQLDWSWRSRVSLDPSARVVGQEVQKAYGLLNGRIAAQIDSINSEISFYARNILGKKYNANGLAIESLGYDFVNRGDPRTFGVQFRVKFGGER